MALIVDGYNVIFAMLQRVPDFTSGECERLRHELLGRLEHYRSVSGEEITVVFDGGPAGAHLARLQHFGGLAVIFSDPGSDADEEIKRLVRESSGARELRVVTDDRDIAKVVRRFRANVSPTETLLRRMTRTERTEDGKETEADPAYKFTGPEPYEVDDWVATFGDVDENDLEDEIDGDETDEE